MLVIYSANEAATTGKGFWQAQIGWVEDVAEATAYDAQDEPVMPESTGGDAALCPLSDFTGAR